VTDFVFIYGPPAAGKYTIAKALAEQLNWPLFHNHVVIDCVSSLLKRGEPGFLDACADVRIALMKHALCAGKSLVSTFVYACEIDDAFVARIRETAENARARFRAVQLVCAQTSLNERCTAPHRAGMGKIATVETLQSVLQAYDCSSKIPGVESLAIDTDSLSVEQSVQSLREHFAL
jgi:adenylylsulfate kinase-like enzyme